MPLERRSQKESELFLRNEGDENIVSRDPPHLYAYSNMEVVFYVGDRIVLQACQQVVLHTALPSP